MNHMGHLLMFIGAFQKPVESNLTEMLHKIRESYTPKSCMSKMVFLSWHKLGLLILFGLFVRSCKVKTVDGQSVDKRENMFIQGV
jgi:hypothetical protein